MTGHRIAEMIVNVDQLLEGELSDWPPYAQDTIYKALEILRVNTGRRYHVIHSEAGYDIDSGPFVRVVAAAILPVIN